MPLALVNTLANRIRTIESRITSALDCKSARRVFPNGRHPLYR